MKYEAVRLIETATALNTGNSWFYQLYNDTHGFIFKHIFFYPITVVGAPAWMQLEIGLGNAVKAVANPVTFANLDSQIVYVPELTNKIYHLGDGFTINMRSAGAGADSISFFIHVSGIKIT